MRGGEFRVLAINPGSTSLKLAVFVNEEAVWTRTVLHAEGEMRGVRGWPVLEQLGFRATAVREALAEWSEGGSGLDAVVGRGGLLRPVPSGTYTVDNAMLEELRRVGMGQEHAANLGAFLARNVAERAGCPAFVVDPVSVDEMAEVARVSGTALLRRQSLSHALNTKAVARRYAREHGVRYADLRLVVAHLGSGISISAHAGGRMIDVNLGGQEGPFSTERCGGLQLTGIVGLCFSGKYTERQLWDLLIREGGLYSYLGTRDLDEVERRIGSGDGGAALVYDAMVYQIAKEIGGMATVLEGQVDAILVTGGMAKSAKLVGQLGGAVGWIAPVAVYPGEDELRALAEGALRVLRGEEAARTLAGEATVSARR